MSIDEGEQYPVGNIACLSDLVSPNNLWIIMWRIRGVRGCG